MILFFLIVMLPICQHEERQFAPQGHKRKGFAAFCKKKKEKRNKGIFASVDPCRSCFYV